MSKYFTNRRECSRHNIFSGVDIATFAGEHMMLSVVTFEPHAIVERHSHPHEQAGMVLEGRARFIVGDEERVLGPGDMYRIPGNIEHRVIAEDEVVTALDVFHPIREDYL